MQSKVIFLMGPTASGKTQLAELLYQQLPCELISVDSSAVYRGLNIGSAKPEPELLARLPHRLIDIREPAETYSAADFLTDALAAIEEIHSNGKHALLVGGTMLYFKALRDGLSELPAADPGVRSAIEQQAAQHGWDSVHAELASVDPQAAQRIHPNDPQRLQRALEVYRLTGVTMTELHQQQHDGNRRLKDEPVQISIQPASRELLHQRIATRFDQMLEQGLVEEVRQLLAQPGAENLPAMRAVGYRQAAQFLRGELDEAGLRERGIIASRQLAKRQLTWLRGWPGAHSLQATEADYSAGFLQTSPSSQRSIFHQALQIC